MPLGLVIFCLIMTLGIGIMTTDLYIPCMALMKIDFATTEEAVQKTIGIAFFGVCISSLMAGPLADRFGKQAVFTVSMILCIVSGGLSPLSPTIEFLYCCRFIQGLAVGVLPVLIIAFISEIYSGKKLTQVLSIVGVVLTVTLSLSPVLGGWIGDSMGWKGCFWVSTAAMGFFLVVLWGRLPVSQQTGAFSKQDFVQKLKALWHSKPFIYYTVIHGLGVAAAFTIRSTLSHYCADVLNFTPFDFGQFLSMAMVANAVTGLSITFLASRIDARLILKVGLFLNLIAAIGYVVLSHFAPLWQEGLLGVLIIQNIAVPLYFTPTLSLAAQQPGISKNIASSVIVSLRSFLSSFFIYLGGVIYIPNLWSITLIYAGLVGIQFFVYIGGRLKIQN